MGDGGSRGGMACASDRPPWRSTGLFRSRDRDEADASSGPPSAASSAEGALRSIADSLGVEFRIPDRTTFSRRGGGLMILPKRMKRTELLHSLVDSIGIKIYGEGEWLYRKDDLWSCPRWRTPRLVVDAHEIAGAKMTPDNVGDVSAAADLLARIERSVGSMAGDGARDCQMVCDAVAKRHPQAAVIILPRSTAVSSKTATTQRDNHLEMTARQGRIGWQWSFGYSRPSLKLSF